MNEYFQVLGLPAGATLQEVKAAYRRKAKLLHPDLNSDPAAKEEFIRVTEAYEILIGERRAKVSRPSFTRAQPRPSTPREKREYARRRAQRAAAMSYAEFEETHLNHPGEAFSLLLYHLFFVLTCLAVAAIPVVFFYIEDGAVLTSVIIAAVFLSPFLIPVLRDYRQMSLRDCKAAAKTVCGYNFVSGTLLTFLNIVLLMRFGFRTMLPFSALFLLYLALPLLYYFAVRKRTPHASFKAGILLPMWVNLLLVLNYTVSFGKSTETYDYSLWVRTVYSRRGNTSYNEVLPCITFNEGTYDSYPAARLYWNNTMIERGRRADLIFARGILGLRVVKDYRLYMP